MSEVIIEAENLSLKRDSLVLLDDLCFSLHKGDVVAIVGASGSGKTSLGKLLSGAYSATEGVLRGADTVKRIMVDQQDHFMARAGLKTTYYSRRYENVEGDDSPELQDFLLKVGKKLTGSDEVTLVEQVMMQLQLEHIARHRLLQLSNGERKRTQLAAALLQKPDLLILDQPFVGLDEQSRQNLGNLLAECSAKGVCIIIICDREHIPSSVHKVMELNHGKIVQFAELTNFQPLSDKEDDGRMNAMDETLSQLLTKKTPEVFEELIRMRNVNVKMGNQTLLENINWQVKSGEQWALLGPNGAGKSTLLSLVTADNPQGYSNDLVLFDRQRGSGETIWEIKQRIGFVSPELHLYFLRGNGIYNSIPGLANEPQSANDSLACLNVIISGFSDEIGFVSAPTEIQRRLAEAWLRVFNLEHLAVRKFSQASLGEQRSLLLARALVKSPSLLILDEPCQGLDLRQTRRFVNLLDWVCRELNTTLVYVTHIKNEIPSCVDKVLQIEQGHIAYCGKFVR